MVDITELHRLFWVPLFSCIISEYFMLYLLYNDIVMIKYVEDTLSEYLHSLLSHRRGKKAWDLPLTPSSSGPITHLCVSTKVQLLSPKAEQILRCYLCSRAFPGLGWDWNLPGITPLLESFLLHVLLYPLLCWILLWAFLNYESLCKYKPISILSSPI